MKKILFVAVAVLVLLCCVSCKDEVKPESSNTVKVCLPNFLQSTSKGLYNMTDSTQNSPFDDFGLAQGIMTTMPVITSLRTVSLDASNLDQQVNNALATTIYPYGMKAVLVNAKSNSDGIYCAYRVIEGEKIVGFFSYYYNSNDNTFSYREFVVVTAPQTNPLLLALEYEDVKIGDLTSSTPSFAVGQLDNEGVFEKNGFVDSIDIIDAISDSSGYVDIKRGFITAKSDSSMFASMTRPGEGIHYILRNNSNPISTAAAENVRYIRTKLKEYIGSKTGEEVSNMYYNDLNLAQGVEMAKYVYPDLEDMVSKLETGFTSYKDYCDLSFKNSVITDMDKVFEVGFTSLERDDISVLRFDTGKGASVQFAYKNFHWMNPSHNEATCPYCSYRPYFHGVPALYNTTNNPAIVSLIESFDTTGFPEYLSTFLSPYAMFERVYGIDPNQSMNEEAYQIALATRHMKACGLSEAAASNYAKNLVYSERQVGQAPEKHYILITAEPFEDFKAAFDAANTAP